jgi:hypothetical protein
VQFAAAAMGNSQLLGSVGISGPAQPAPHFASACAACFFKDNCPVPVMILEGGLKGDLNYYVMQRCNSLARSSNKKWIFSAPFCKYVANSALRKF